MKGRSRAAGAWWAAIVAAVAAFGGVPGAAGQAVAAGNTYYVRTDGGEPTQCDGRADLPYPGNGSAQSCAWDHPFRALPPGGPPRIAGGDTLIIGAGSYRMGLGAPGAEACDPLAPQGCTAVPLPPGPSAESPTRLLGAGWDTGCAQPPELWGAEGADRVLDLSGTANVVVACLEITDHETCVDDHALTSLRCETSTTPVGNWARVGIYAEDAREVRLEDVNIHGLAHTGIHAGRLRNWTLRRVRMAGNGWAGWDGDIDGDDANAGTMAFLGVRIEWNGCAERYPGGDPIGCWSQSAGGYGDGLGTGSTGGRWVFEESIVQYNTSDGIDLLYLEDGTVEVRRTLVRGNAGNQIKTRGSTIVENAIVAGNCGSFDAQPYTYWVDHCRAFGNALAFTLGRNEAVVLANNTLTSEGDCLLELECTNAIGAGAIVARNNIFQGQPDFLAPGERTCLAYAGGGCGSDPFDIDYSVIAGVKDAACPGANDLCVGWAGLLDDSPDNFDAHIIPSSPAVDSGLGVGGLVPGEDFAGFVRPYGTGVDRGAYELGSFEPAPTRTATPTPTPTAAPAQSREERLCRKEIRKQLNRLFKLRLTTMQRCIDAVNEGSIPPPCPDAQTADKLAEYDATLDPADLEDECPAAVLAALNLRGSCAGAASGAALASCIAGEAAAAAQRALAAEYADPAASLPDPQLLDCQASIAGRAARPFAVKRLRLMNGCLTKLETGRVAFCPDERTQRRLDASAARVEPIIAPRCSDAVLQSLFAGSASPCAADANAAAMAACQIAEHQAATDTLIAVTAP